MPRTPSADLATALPLTARHQLPLDTRVPLFQRVLRMSVTHEAESALPRSRGVNKPAACRQAGSCQFLRRYRERATTMKKFIGGVVTIVLAIFATFFLAQGAKGQAVATNTTASTVTNRYGIKPLAESGVPDALPIGSEEAVRSFIVGNYGLVLNVFVSLGFSDNGIPRKLTYPTIATWGYESYDAFLDTCVYAGSQALTRFGHEPSTINYKPGVDVWAMVEVRYVGGPQYSTGLFIKKNVGPSATITEESIRDAFSLATKSTTEQLIISIPNLKRHHIAVAMESETVTFEWTADGGVKTSPTWPTRGPSGFQQPEGRT